MAALSPGSQRLLYTAGDADRVCLYSVINVDNLDTLDVATQFTVPKKAVFISTTSNLAGLCTIAGTVVTWATVGLADDAGYLLVWGAST